MQATQVWSLGREDPLEKGMATHSSILAWRIPMDKGAWRATVHGVEKSRTRLSTHTHTEWEKVEYWFLFLRPKKAAPPSTPSLSAVTGEAGAGSGQSVKSGQPRQAHRALCCQSCPLASLGVSFCPFSKASTLLLKKTALLEVCHLHLGLRFYINTDCGRSKIWLKSAV